MTDETDLVRRLEEKIESNMAEIKARQIEDKLKEMGAGYREIFRTRARMKGVNFTAATWEVYFACLYRFYQSFDAEHDDINKWNPAGNSLTEFKRKYKALEHCFDSKAERGLGRFISKLNDVYNETGIYVVPEDREGLFISWFDAGLGYHCKPGEGIPDFSGAFDFNPKVFEDSLMSGDLVRGYRTPLEENLNEAILDFVKRGYRGGGLIRYSSLLSDVEKGLKPVFERELEGVDRDIYNGEFAEDVFCSPPPTFGRFLSARKDYFFDFLGRSEFALFDTYELRGRAEQAIRERTIRALNEERKNKIINFGR